MWGCSKQETVSVKRYRLTIRWIPIINITWSHHRLIFIMAIHHTQKDPLYIETGPRFFDCGHIYVWAGALKWHHNGHNGVSNHKHHNCLLNRLFRHRSKKASKRKNFSIWWRHHVHVSQITDCLHRSNTGPVDSKSGQRLSNHSCWLREVRIVRNGDIWRW